MLMRAGLILRLMAKIDSAFSSFLNSTINNPGASLITKSRIFYFPKRASAERAAYFTATQYRLTYGSNVFTAAPSVSAIAGNVFTATSSVSADAGIVLTAAASVSADAGNVFTAESIELSAISKQETITNNLK